MTCRGQAPTVGQYYITTPNTLACNPWRYPSMYTGIIGGKEERRVWQVFAQENIEMKIKY